MASVEQVVTGTLVGGTAPTVSATLSNAIAEGDVVVAQISTNGSDGDHTIAGLGATWTRTGRDSIGLLDMWIGVGATTTGQVTATQTVAPTGSGIQKGLTLWHVRGATSAYVGGADNATGNTLTSTPMTAGPGQVFIGSGYSDSDASAFMSEVPGTGWVKSATIELAVGQRFAVPVHRLPAASESHTFNTFRSGSTAHPLVRLVVGTLDTSAVMYSTAVEYIHLHAGVESNSAKDSAAAEPTNMNVGLEIPLAQSDAAVEPVLSNVGEIAYDPEAPGPAVVTVNTSANSASANPTVNFTGTPEVGDVLLLAVFTGGSQTQTTNVSGCGATWEKIPGATTYLYSFWLGTGATSSGTITATGASYANGQIIRVHHLRGVEPFAVAQYATTGYKMRVNGNQILVGYGYSTSTTTGSSIDQASKVPGGMWNDDTEVGFPVGGNRANSSRLITAGPMDAHMSGQSSALLVAVGSPVAGATVTKSALVYNGGFEVNSAGWGPQNSNTASSTDTAKFGTRSCKVTASGTVPGVIKLTGSSPGPYCIPGRTYTASAYVKSVNARNVRINLRWAPTSGAVSSVTNGAPTALAAGGDWVRITVTGVAPALQVFAGVGVELTDGVSGDIFYVDGVRVEEGSSATDYFDASMTTPDRINVDVPSSGFYSVQTTVPSAPAPSVPNVFIGAVTFTNTTEPTVEVTATPQRRDVLVAIEARGHTSMTEPTGMTGCGATWERIGGGNNYQTCWVGIGASFAGTVTAIVDGTLAGSGRNVRVYQLRGVSPDVYLQHQMGSYPVAATSNQIVLSSAYSQSSSVAPFIGGNEPPLGWVNQTETVFVATDRRHNTTHIIPPSAAHYDVKPGAYGIMLVVGSPVAGMRITRRNMTPNPSMESGVGMWGGSGTIIRSRTQLVSAVGNASATAAYNNNSVATFNTATGSNGPLAPIVPGRTYTLSAWVRCNSERNAGIVPMWCGINQGLNSTGSYTYSPLPASTWTRFSWTGIAPAGAYFAGAEVKITGNVAGDVYWWDGFMIEESGAVGEYFDGGSGPPSGKLNYFNGPSDLYQSLQLEPMPPYVDVSFNHRVDGVWINKAATPRVYVDGAWVAKRPQYWDGADWVDLE